MKQRPIPETTRQAQLAVSDPASSAWVSANAGSGKTYVLAQRVIRLLLRGTPPARILCLTFTKAAAAHMANQVMKTLRDWVGLDDTSLDAKLAALDGGKPAAERRAEARRLFATALETPGGLKVQTIHAFCDRVLHQFPFEARVPAGFEVLEETGEADLLRRARAEVLLAAAHDRDSALGKALATAITAAADSTLSEVFDEAVRARRKLQHLLESDGLARAEREAAEALGLSAGDSLARVEEEIVFGPHLPRTEWKAVSDALLQLSGNSGARGEQLAEAAAITEPSQAIEPYISVFCTEKGELRADSQFGASKLREQEPVLRLIRERDRLLPLIERRRAAQALERTRAIHVLGRAMIESYEAMKAARGALDYDDLVSRTADLLENQAAAWVHYKLDGGIDHILIDEAQDTSPEQWKVIERLAEEFFAGEGAAASRLRTIFAVGDEKQSIFGFQGASPKSFGEMRKIFSGRAEAATRDFRAGRLDLSFRSAEGIVRAVDVVFGEAAAFRGLSYSESETHTIHEAIRKDAPALVEVWETVRPEKDPDDGLAWDAPLDAMGAASPTAMLAARIAMAAKVWLAKPDFLIGDPETEELRRPHSGDIIVLVRSRGPLFEAILRELKNADIPVAGADRLQLAEHIAVMDIAALGDALLLEPDDLALACALKSPLFGLGEDDLYQLAHGRKGTLLQALEQATEPKFREAAARLARWREEARALRPFDFLSRLLGRDQGRERILARLGIEAADALDELLAHALAYEATETPSLQGFLSFLRRGGSQVKRDLEVESRAVRVMTVHGVKGLEAPIVVLADTTTVPNRRHHPKLMPVGNSMIWTAGEDSRAVAAARNLVAQANEEEHRRLLYVALTRARDALVVCGFQSQRASELPEGCWYTLVRDALERNPDEFREISDHGYGFSEKIFRWRYQPAKAAAMEISAAAEKIREPSWLRKPVVSREPRRSTPTAGADSLPAGNGAIPRALARHRGILIHRLLQELPRFEPEQRAARAKTYLDRFAADLPAGERETILRETLSVLDDPVLKELFGPASRAEVSILGKWDADGIREFPGRVDRFAVTNDAVLIADYKSDAEPPADARDTPFGYIAQLARYRAVLARIFPGKAMRGFLIWTAKPAVHELPSKLLDETFRRLTSL